MTNKFITFIFLLVFSIAAYSQEVEFKKFPNDDQTVYPIHVGNKTLYKESVSTRDTIMSRIDYIKLKNYYSYNNNLNKRYITILEKYSESFVLARITDKTYELYDVGIVVNNPVEYALYYRKKSIACYCAGFGCFVTGSIFMACAPFIKDRPINNNKIFHPSYILYGLGSAAYIAGSACMITGIVFSVKKEKYLIIGCSNYGISAQWKF